jgi:hypothetical protein
MGSNSLRRAVLEVSRRAIPRSRMLDKLRSNSPPALHIPHHIFSGMGKRPCTSPYVAPISTDDSCISPDQMSAT